MVSNGVYRYPQVDKKLNAISKFRGLFHEELVSSVQSMEQKGRLNSALDWSRLNNWAFSLPTPPHVPLRRICGSEPVIINNESDFEILGKSDVRQVLDWREIRSNQTSVNTKISQSVWEYSHWRRTNCRMTEMYLMKIWHDNSRISLIVGKKLRPRQKLWWLRDENCQHLEVSSAFWGS